MKVPRFANRSGERPVAARGVLDRLPTTAKPTPATLLRCWTLGDGDDDDAPNERVRIADAWWRFDHFAQSAVLYAWFFHGKEDATAGELWRAANAMVDRHRTLNRIDIQLMAARVNGDGLSSEERVGLAALRALPMEDDALADLEALIRDDAESEGVHAAPPKHPAAPVGAAYVWQNTNAARSHGRVRAVDLSFLTRTEDGFAHPCFRIVTDVRDIGRVLPDTTGSGVTDPRFDVAQVAYTLDRALARLGTLGFPLEPLRARPIEVVPHGSELANAFSHPAGKRRPAQLEFGWSYGALHFASDADNIVHELGHFVLHQLSPLQYQGESRAFHEGFANALAALMGDSPLVSESYRVLMLPPALASEDLREPAVLTEPPAEAHTRGNVYAALFWRLREALRDAFLPDRAATDAVLCVLLATGAALTPRRVTPADIARALERGLEAAQPRLAEIPGWHPDLAERLRTTLGREIVARGLVVPDGR